jgi:ribosomal protein S27E
MIHECPGVTDLKTPSLSIKECPKCGEEVEVFSNDLKVTCKSCGLIISNEGNSSTE